MKDDFGFEMDQFLKGLFPDRNSEEAYEEIIKQGASYISELEFLKK